MNHPRIDFNSGPFYYKFPDMQDEMIVGVIWGKTPYYKTLIERNMMKSFFVCARSGRKR